MNSGAGWLILVPVLAILSGVVLILVAISLGRKAKASLQWPAVPGTVLLSQLVEDNSGEFTSYLPLVTYAYAVNGQAFQSSRVAFVASKSRKVIAKYPKGNAVQVYFDPQQPSTSVLEKGGSTRFMVFIGIALIIGGCVAGLVMA